jgi:hypothetical protein
MAADEDVYNGVVAQSGGLPFVLAQIREDEY